ncbi:hypothetical protein JQX13_19480 [Archangium violaceum]|uniref:hypothetical protein n=1 Tax=Archangium violaceum TaxID=83451 RepID=UPI00193B75BD|nr:hypothetical protein [Archangium violaceum]QRK12029.1 hypothetical protein JQX13_19480 [Archangium violaceum]
MSRAVMLGCHISEVEHMDEVGPRTGAERTQRWWLSKLLGKPEMQEALLLPVGRLERGRT